MPIYKDLTSDQKKCIDLLKTRELKNISLAIQLNISNNLRLEDIYLDLYNKWKHIITPKGYLSEDSKESIEYFPLLTLAKDYFNYYCIKRSRDGFKDVRTLLWFFEDTGPFFSLTDGELHIPVDMTMVPRNDYTTLAKCQKQISQFLNIETNKIHFSREDLPF